jgi:hypothetical protein
MSSAMRAIGRVRVGCILLVSAAACDRGPRFQSGQHVGDDIVVRWDNPDFTEVGITLAPATTKWNGVMERTVDATPAGVVIGNGDFRVRTDLGDGPAMSSGVSVFASVREEELSARPDADGHFGSAGPSSVVDLVAHGLRVGHTPLAVRMAQIEPNRSFPAPFTTSRVRLDTSVALVPIEAVVVFHEKDAGGHFDGGTESQRRTAQLMFWDHSPDVQTTNITDGQFGEITSAQHAMRWVRRDGNGRYGVATQMAPDAVWQRCGVQFRVVNYIELQVPHRNVRPAEGDADGDPDRFWPTGTVDDAPLRENVGLAKRDPRHMEGTVTVVFMDRVSFPDAPEVGRALAGNGAIGVSLSDNRSSNGVVGHELGHLSGLRDATGSEKDGAGKPMFDVMVGLGPGVDPTDAECRRMKPWAEGFVGWWTKPHPRPHDP